MSLAPLAEINASGLTFIDPKEPSELIYDTIGDSIMEAAANDNIWMLMLTVVASKKALSQRFWMWLTKAKLKTTEPSSPN